MVQHPSERPGREGVGADRQAVTGANDTGLRIVGRQGVAPVAGRDADSALLDSSNGLLGSPLKVAPRQRVVFKLKHRSNMLLHSRSIHVSHHDSQDEMPGRRDRNLALVQQGCSRPVTWNRLRCVADDQPSSTPLGYGGPVLEVRAVRSALILVIRLAACHRSLTNQLSKRLVSTAH